MVPQETWAMLPPDAGSETTAIAVGIAKLGEPAVALQAAKYGGGFVASGRASSVAAGRLSYVNGLKVTSSFLLLVMLQIEILSVLIRPSLKKAKLYFKLCIKAIQKLCRPQFKFFQDVN